MIYHGLFKFELSNGLSDRLNHHHLRRLRCKGLFFGNQAKDHFLRP